MTPILKKSGGHIELGVEHGQLCRIGQHMDFEDAGLTNLQGDDPGKSPPIEREEEWFSLIRHLDQGRTSVVAEEIDRDIPRATIDRAGHWIPRTKVDVTGHFGIEQLEEIIDVPTRACVNERLGDQLVFWVERNGGRESRVL